MFYNYILILNINKYWKYFSLISPSNEVVPFAIGKNVVLQLERELHPRDRDSSRASTKQICEYKWEDKSTYTGRILSCTGRLAAYRLYNENTGEAVRVLDRDTRSRHLIKDFRARTGKKIFLNKYFKTFFSSWSSMVCNYTIFGCCW